MDSLQRKGINFDLNTQSTKGIFIRKVTGIMHMRDVRDFLEANGFEAYSGIGISFGGSNVRSEKATAVVCQMTKEFPWLNYCVNVCTISDVLNCLISHPYFAREAERLEKKNA